MPYRLLIAAAIPLILWLLPFKATGRQLQSLAFTLWLVGGLVLLLRAGQTLLPIAQAAFSGEAEVGITAFAVAVIVALLIGGAKGLFILRKSCHRNLRRLGALKQPVKFIHVYDVRSWVLILLMISLSALMPVLQLDPLIRGSVLLAVGFGLLLSSRFYREPLASFEASV